MAVSQRCAGARPAAVGDKGALVVNISPIQIIIVLVIALLVFGPKKLPELARSVGRGVREFRGAISLDSDDESPSERAGRGWGGSSPSTAVVQDDGEREPGVGAMDGSVPPEDDGDALDGVVVRGGMPPPARPSDPS